MSFRSFLVRFVTCLSGDQFPQSFFDAVGLRLFLMIVVYCETARITAVSFLKIERIDRIFFVRMTLIVPHWRL